MKPISSPTCRVLARSVVVAFLGCMSLVSFAGANDNAVVRSEGNISYASGGVGSESLEQLASMARDFNVKLVFALASGDYLSNVRVVIADAKGKTLLDTLADGPWFLAKIPVGRYQIAATLAGQEKKRQISVGTEKLMTVDFRWKSP